MDLKKVVTGGFFVALGIVLPIGFHMVGGSSVGKMLLPMHIPVLLAGFFTGPAIGFFVGFLTPLLSSILTGMPPFSPPVAPMMMIELPIYGFLAGWLYERLKLNVFISLLITLFAGRLVYGIAGAVLLPLFGLKGISPLYPVTAGLVTGIPGLVVQIILIPAVVKILKR
ncbi:MAG: hypothetical protein PWQ82_1037 [Thermosediminibacterales bacterium]|nr:hypothetical protein [Thermosediminibacterales bacterium]